MKKTLSSLTLMALCAIPLVSLAADLPQPNFGSERNTHRVEEAPKAIPHPINRFIPITKDTNYCAMCHLPAKSLQRGYMEMPITHMTKNGMDPRREPCTTCHMPMFTPEK